MNLDKIKEAVPEAAEQDHIKALAADLDKAQDLRNAVDSPGGKLLVEALKNDCSSVIGQIIREVKDPLVFKLEAHLNLLTTLLSASGREESLQSLMDQEIKSIIAP